MARFFIPSQQLHDSMIPLIFAMESYYGVSEIKGSKHNPIILEYFDQLGYDSSKLSDETAWCAAGANAVLKKKGYQHTGQLNAYSFLSLSEEVEENKARFGDLVVFWRGNGPNDMISGTNIPKSHIAFVVSIDYSKCGVCCYGGNQSNKWQVSAYYLNRVRGFRRPQKNGL